MVTIIVDTLIWQPESSIVYTDHYFSLRFEGLLDHPWKHMSRLWTFLGANPDQTGLKESLLQELAKNPDAEYQEQKAGQIANSVQKGKRGNWKDVFTQQDQRIFQTIAGETLSKWGYKQEYYLHRKEPL